MPRSVGRGQHLARIGEGAVPAQARRTACAGARGAEASRHRAYRAHDAGRPAHHGRAATGRDRAHADPRRARSDPRRADCDAFRYRDRADLRGAAGAQARGQVHHLHHPPARGGVPHLRHGDGAAQRRTGRDAAGRRPRPQDADRDDARPQLRRDVSRAAQGRRRRGAGGEGAARAGPDRRLRHGGAEGQDRLHRGPGRLRRGGRRQRARRAGA